MMRYLLVLYILASCNPVEYTEDNSSEFDFSVSNASRFPSSLDALSNRQARLGDRYYIENVFKTVFGPNYNSGSVVSRNIFIQQDVFGGSCDLYEDLRYFDNSGTLISEDNRTRCYSTNRNTPMITTTNTLREGWRIKTCEVIISQNPTAVAYALNKAQVDTEQDPTESAIGRVYNLFYPLEVIDEGTLEIFYAESKNVTDKSDFWEAVLTAVCVTPTWQIP